MIIVEEKEALERLTMPVCIELMEKALSDLAVGKCCQPMRSVLTIPGNNSFGFMPAHLGDCFGAKIITAFHGNLGTKYPSHMGYVMIFEAEHGAPVGMADANIITMVRTGAVSGVATQYLARRDARKLAIIGCGAQGRSHLEAMLCVRPSIETVTCYDISAENARRYAQEMTARFGRPVTPCASVQEAVADADIVCTVTPSKEAYLEADWIKPGCHINAVGTFTPTTREVTSALVARSRLYADHVEAMKKEAGEYLIPLSEGLITPEHIVGSIGDVINGTAPARGSETEITLFDALGLAVEDVMCGKYLVLGA